MMAKTILLVDDSATCRMKSRAMFADHNDYELISACDGREGVERAIADKPDLILMDVEMPRMSGVDACKALRQNAATKNIPIVLMTMRGEDEAVKAGVDSGCNEYLLKTASEDKVMSVVRRYLR
jgi:CheY-like chemotaxis protein